MADKLFGSEDFEVNRADPRGRWVLPWLFLLGFLIYELTTYPALGVGTVCLKFGWEDFRTALWLRRTDPLPARARACFWLYMSFGLLKTAITGGILMLVCATFAAPVPNQQANLIGNAPSVEFVVAGMTAMGAFMFSALSTCIAMFKAWRGRFKLWLSYTVHIARRQDCWPPPDLSPQIPNQARAILLAAIIAIGTLICLSLVPLLLFIGQVVNPVLSTCCVVAMLIVVPILLFSIAGYVSRGLAARPSDCWEAASVA